MAWVGLPVGGKQPAHTGLELRVLEGIELPVTTDDGPEVFLELD